MDFQKKSLKEKEKKWKFKICVLIVRRVESRLLLLASRRRNSNPTRKKLQKNNWTKVKWRGLKETHIFSFHFL
jgi:hypothetical protein